jgi:non-ribosomal peptide synthetase component F
LQAVLCRYSGQEEVVVGVPVAGRDRPETHPIIGYFINSLPIRGGLGDTSAEAEGPTLAAMARAASQALTEALAHALLPLAQLAAAVRAERFPGANPVFQVRWATCWQGLRPVLFHRQLPAWSLCQRCSTAVCGA